jgi:hypothetical protein
MLPFPISYYLTNGTEVFVGAVNNGENRNLKATMKKRMNPSK